MLVKEARSIFEPFSGFEDWREWFDENADQDFELCAMKACQEGLVWAATVLSLHQALESYESVQEPALKAYKEVQEPALKAYKEVEQPARRILAQAVVAEVERRYAKM